MDSNALGSIITNPTARKAIYATYVVVGLILGSIQAWYGDGAPDWLGQYLAVYGYVGIPVGGLAIANTPKPAPDFAASTADTDVAGGGD